MANSPTQPPVAAARPTLYIDVDLHGKRMTLDVPTATSLHVALTDALAQLREAAQEKDDLNGEPLPPEA